MDVPRPPRETTAGCTCRTTRGTRYGMVRPRAAGCPSTGTDSCTSGADVLLRAVTLALPVSWWDVREGT